MARPDGDSPNLRESCRGYGYLFPAALILGVFGIAPLLYGFYVSLFRWGIVREAFVGFDNYIRALQDKRFWQSLAITVWYVIGTVPVAMILGYGIARLLFRKLRARGLYRTLYFLPFITSTVAAAMVWRWIFYPDNRGLVNAFLTLLGKSPEIKLGWTQDPRGVLEIVGQLTGIDLSGAGGPSLALLCVIIFSIWHSLGFNIVIFLAGLSAVPKETVEAAEVDGASSGQVSRHVILPLLSPTIYFLLIISSIRAFRAFNQIYILAHGETMGTTRNITLFIFHNFYELESKVGYGSAVAFLLFGAILVMTLVQMRIAGRRVHYW